MFNFCRSEKMLLVLMVLALVVALRTGLERHKIESGNRNVEIIVDGRDLLVLSNAVGVTPSEAAARLKASGATCLAADEVSLSELEARRLVIIKAWDKDQSLLSFSDRTLAEMVQAALKQRLPSLQTTLAPVQASNLAGDISQAYDFSLIVEGKLGPLQEIDLLLDPAQVKAAHETGLRLAARIKNASFFRPESIAFALSAASKTGADLVIFDEEEVLGYDGGVSYTAAAMKQLGLVYGWVELAEQRGEEKMRRQMWDSMLRVHGISDKEMPKLNREKILERLTRAARERNIRACYAHLFLRPQKNLLQYNADFFAELARRLQGAGLTPGKAAPYPPWETPPWMFLLLGMGISAGAALLAGRLLPLGGLGRIIVFFLFLVLLALCKWALNKPGDSVLVRQVWGLLAGLTFPSLGLILAWQKMSGGAPADRKAPTPALKSILLSIVLVVEVTAFSLIGGLFIVGMLSETKFLIGVEQFRGVKLLLLGPVLLLVTAMASGLVRPFAGNRDWRNQVNKYLRAFAGQPLLVGEALLLVGIAGALGILVLRSGNISSAAPAIEHQARAWLESSFWVRPRTKEFLLGHPALFIAALLWLMRQPLTFGFGPGQQRLIPVLLLVAALGQASIANTFCHLHTPLMISLFRTINGVGLGLLVGAVLMLIWLLARRILLPPAEAAASAESV